MNQDNPVDASRRFWVGTTCVAGGVAAAGVAVPFVSTFAPSERAKAAGAPVEADIAGMAVGEIRTVEWRGNPVWILRRSPEQIESLKATESEVADPKSLRSPGEITPEYASNQWRSRKPEYLVAVGICPHLGCSPTARMAPGAQTGLPADWHGGFLCPCHGSTFDVAGRVYKNKPAPDNLTIPPHQYLSETKILVGVDENNKA
ncbi:ubiquinol-cytochrome c reductase iron-sulfur subunit [Pigmentiphaga aceris]|uniref:Ubiquinol-cytochrome c reductase iron-sulfur subunit n=1 Tax=Pigmentiphaga aceris TaxID=1940612 RepID=A0A5C0ARW2_9BURK|nr:ubiquinol-cytochrome c reductase iron-sulfur subunit [Pigmentiphaga aceris]QEI04909.1 ubiquinol-cytochrome c reductase iron-sulfur subunit [Pigmentiphaga aceris]